MKLLKRSSLSFLILLLLAPFSQPGIAQAQKNSIRTFSWEGLSLSMTPDQMVNTLVGDGYTQLRVIEDNKKTSIYQRKTQTGSNKVQFIEKNGLLTKLIFSEKRTGGKNNLLSPQAANSTLTSIKNKLGIDDSSCTSGAKGGGSCSAQPNSKTHNNSYSVSIKPRNIKITISSNPISQALMESNIESNIVMTEDLASAYGCLGTTDITSAREIHDCINLSLKELVVLEKAKKITRLKHMPVYPGSPQTPCWQLSNYYRRGLAYLKNNSDSTSIPNCETFADVIKLAAGSPAPWSGCLNENGSDEFIKGCVDSINSSYFKLVNQRIPSCRDIQVAYQRGVAASRDTAANISTVTPPECERVISFAKSLRKPLTEDHLACAGYDPDKAREHILKCLTSDFDLRPLKNCQQVQVSYRRKIMLSNYGYVPEPYVPIKCEETKDLMAKADTVRKRLNEEEAERQRLAKLASEAEEHAYKLKKVQIKEELAKKYADTPQAVASRTSKLEKELKANGKVKYKCKATSDNKFYCPPTIEEMRLAMMRNHASIFGSKVINGDMVHGNLNARMGNIGFGSKYLGTELKYGKITILSSCSRSGEFYDCYFKLDLQHYIDKETLHLRGYAPNVTTHMQFIKRDYYSYYFWIGKDGLWHTKPTEAQLALDQDIIDWQEKVNQDLMNSSENPWGVDGL